MKASDAPLHVFCSFAPEDEDLCTLLHNHLRPLEQAGTLTLWHQRLITAGTDWTTAIDEQLTSASIILLLISPAFFASDYCYGTEMKRALERQEAGEARVIPLLVRSVDWKDAPFAHLSPLPTTGKPLAEQRHRDFAFANVVVDLRRVIEELAPNSTNRSPTNVLSSVWNVPYRRNPHFTGRDELLERLEQQLSPEAYNGPATTRRVALTQPQAIKGLGGIGKTQIAVEYAYRSRELDRYVHTLWINAASEETIMTSFVTLAELLPAFSAKSETDQRKLVAAIKRWLEQCQQGWLLIFDNADDISIIQDYVPQRGNGSILLTTRADAVGSLATSIGVETMSFVEGTHLLLRRAQRFEHASDEEINEAGNIVVALDHFPLALDQAGAYIEETKCHLVDYLEIYHGHRKALLARRGTQATNYPDSVATTWSLSFQKVERANPAAAELLRLCAFLEPDSIPEDLISEGSAHLGSVLHRAARDVFTLNKALEELCKFSLVQRHSETKMLHMHRLVQAVLKDAMKRRTRRQWAERAVRATSAVFPEKVDMETWPRCRRYLPQAQSCTSLIQDYALTFREAASLLHRTADYLQEHALYVLAGALYHQALHIQIQALGSHHPDVAKSLNNLAILYYKQGNFAQAEPLYQQALHILEPALGSDHPQVAYVLIGLANLYQEQENFAQAELLYQRALHILEPALGSDHPQVGYALNGLANLYYKRERYEEAEPLYQQVLRIWEQTLGSDHPNMAHLLSNRAFIYYKQGKYANAEELYQRALRIEEQVFGPDHPNVAYPLGGLANLYREQGKDEQAELLYQRALRIREQTLEPQHPETAGTLYDFAVFREAQGKSQEAEFLYRRALAIREQIFGPAHPKTSATRERLRAMLPALSKTEEAAALEAAQSESAKTE